MFRRERAGVRDEFDELAKTLDKGAAKDDSTW